MTDQSDAQFGSPDCTCIPWTSQDGTPRYCGPNDTVDMIGGWERRRDCPHHAPTPTPVAHATPCGPNVCGVIAHEAAAPEPEPGLREQYAAAMAELDCAKFNCPVPDKGHGYWRIWYAQADAVLNVRDAELQQLRDQLEDLRHNLALRAFTAPDADFATILTSLDARIRDALNPQEPS